jgi:hypothetical protein
LRLGLRRLGLWRLRLGLPSGVALRLRLRLRRLVRLLAGLPGGRVELLRRSGDRWPRGRRSALRRPGSWPDSRSSSGANACSGPA